MKSMSVEASQESKQNKTDDSTAKARPGVRTGVEVVSVSKTRIRCPHDLLQL